MEELLTISDWIIVHHPEMTIDEELWKQDNGRRDPGKAWMHFYGIVNDKDFIIRYDDYETIKGEYDKYVSETSYANERERRKL